MSNRLENLPPALQNVTRDTGRLVYVCLPSFFACQNHLEVLKHVLQVISDQFEHLNMFSFWGKSKNGCRGGGGGGSATPTSFFHFVTQNVLLVSYKSVTDRGAPPTCALIVENVNQEYAPAGSDSQLLFQPFLLYLCCECVVFPLKLTLH